MKTQPTGVQPVDVKPLAGPATATVKIPPRPPIETSYWPLGHAETSGDPRHVETVDALALRLGSVPIQIEYELPRVGEIREMARLAVARQARVTLFWSMYHHVYWNNRDPRVRNEGYWREWTPRLAEIGAALKSVRGLGPVRLVFDTEVFADAHLRAHAIGLDLDSYRVEAERILTEGLRRAVEGLNCALVTQADARFYGMGWRQWHGVTAPQSVGEPYVGIIAPLRHCSSVIIDRPHQLDGWLSSYSASMLGRTECVVWPWLYESKQWVATGDGDDPTAPKLQDMPGDYGREHARTMGEFIYRRLQRARLAVIYPRPYPEIRDGWMGHLDEMLAGAGV